MQSHQDILTSDVKGVNGTLIGINLENSEICNCNALWRFSEICTIGGGELVVYLSFGKELKEGHCSAGEADFCIYYYIIFIILYIIFVLYICIL